MSSPIILLHAFPLAPAMFDELRAELTFPIHTPALPGFGRIPLSREQPSLSVLAKWVLTYADEQNLDQFIVGGVSLGGYVVMELMRLAPERLLGALLIDTKAGEDSPEGKTNRERIARLALQHGTNSLLGSMLPPLTGKMTKAINPHIVQRVSQIFGQADPASVAWTQRAMATRQDSFSTLQKFSRPLLVIVGEEDEIAPVADARQMTETNPQGELAIIEGAGHLAVLEQPAQCARVIEQWASQI